MRNELARLLREVQKNRARFEHRKRRAAGVALRVVVDERGHLVVRRDREVFRLELLALADVHRHDAMGQVHLGERDGDLVAVRRRPEVQIEHGYFPVTGCL
jgi:hypothetical protein